MRVFLRAMGTSLHELMLNFPLNKSQLGFQVVGVNHRDLLIRTEFLQISDEETDTMTCDKQDGRTIARRLWGFPSGTSYASYADVHRRLSLIEAEILPRAGIELSDLAQIIKTNYINPGALEDDRTFDEAMKKCPNPAVIVDNDSGGAPGQLSNAALTNHNRSR